MAEDSPDLSARPCSPAPLAESTTTTRPCPADPRGAREWLSWVRNGWLTRETVAIIKLAIPMVSINFFYQMTFTVALVFVGHSTGRALELDAASLALSFANVTGVSVGIGLASAAETLCSQMYGFKNYKGVGVVTQRGIWILGLAMLPVLVLWLNTESLLLFIQQDPCVARLTALYVRIFASSLPALYVFLMVQRYLQAQSIVLPFVLVGVASNIISAALHGILIYWAGLGLAGSAIAIVVSTISSPLLLLLYTRFCNLHRKTWGGWSFEGLRGWGPFIRLGVPGLLMLCFEWWSYELAAFVVGSINRTQLGIHTILMQILSLNYMLPYGVSMAVTVRVGNELGAGSPIKAKQATYTAFGLITVQTVVVGVLVFATRNVLGKIFSRDKEIIEGVATVLYAGIPLMVFDNFQGMMQGVLRGTGKQLSGAIYNFISFYIIGFPVGVVLAIVAGMGALGMWIGLLLGCALQMLFYLVIIFTMNWEKESQKAIKRAQSCHADGQTPVSGQGDQDSVNSLATEEGEWEEDEEDTARLVFRDSSRVVLNGDVAPVSAVVDSEHRDKSGKTIEEVPLIEVGDNDEDELAPDPLSPTSPPSHHHHHQPRLSHKAKSNMKLLLSRVCLLVVGVMFVVLAGVASRYHPYVPASDYCECEDMSWNSTREWACGNETQDSLLGKNFSISPSLTMTLDLVPSSTMSLVATPTPHNTS